MNKPKLWAQFYAAALSGGAGKHDAEDRANHGIEQVELYHKDAFTPSSVWRDIASAPKDDIIISLCTGCEVNEAHWVDGKWMDLRGNYIYPEYWMPLPGRPAKEAR